MDIGGSVPRISGSDRAFGKLFLRALLQTHATTALARRY
jgi:hypothetical protein